MELFRTYQNPYRIKSHFSKETKCYCIEVYDISRNTTVDYIGFNTEPPTWDEIQTELIKRGYK